jgi:hypothetical protein
MTLSVLTSSSVFCNAKYRGGVRRTEGLKNTGSGVDRVETPLFLLVIDEIRGIPAGRESKFTIQPVVV